MQIEYDEIMNRVKERQVVRSKHSFRLSNKLVDQFKQACGSDNESAAVVLEELIIAFLESRLKKKKK